MRREQTSTADVKMWSTMFARNTQTWPRGAVTLGDVWDLAKKYIYIHMYSNSYFVQTFWSWQSAIKKKNVFSFIFKPMSISREI